MAALFRNNVAGTLAANIGPSDTLILLGSGQGAKFPAPNVANADYFYATLVHGSSGLIEIVRCTSRSGDTLTVTRGRDSTTAISFTTGSAIEMRLVAVSLVELDYRAKLGVANGIAPTDASNFVPIGYIPATIARQADLVAGLAAKQANLGFSPVQQGTGVGQNTNVVKIGWAGAKTLITIDATDMGAIAMEGWATATFIPNSALGVANGVAPLNVSGLIPSGYIPALGYVPLNGAANINGAWIHTGDLQNAGDIKSYRPGTPNSGVLYLNQTGDRYVFWSGTEYQMPGGNGILAVNFTSTSDKRLKKKIRTHKVDPELAFKLQLKDWTWKNQPIDSTGVIAQDVQAYAPQHVVGGETLGLDKAGLALEAVVSLAAYVKALEKRFAHR